MNPLNCFDDTELDLQHEFLRDVKTNVLPAGETTVQVFIRTFRLSPRWKSESADSLWSVWVQYDDEIISPRLLGLAYTEAQIYESILYQQLASHVYKAVYVIQQYAPKP
jgi:hypothetical protein